MATLALDPILVAKINALLASCAACDGEEGLSQEDVLELFEAFLSEQPRVEPSSAHTTGPQLSSPKRS